MKTIILAIVLLASAITANGAADPASRLREARSLRCNFTSVVATWVRRGQRTIEQTSDKGTAVYDNINFAKGTARIVGNIGAADAIVWLERTTGSLWITERTPEGNEFVTTIFPVYSKGTDEFVVLEARHSIVGQTILGEESFGTCSILE